MRPSAAVTATVVLAVTTILLGLAIYLGILLWRST